MAPGKRCLASNHWKTNGMQKGPIYHLSENARVVSGCGDHESAMKKILELWERQAGPS